MYGYLLGGKCYQHSLADGKLLHDMGPSSVCSPSQAPPDM